MQKAGLSEVPKNIKIYTKDLKTKAACERYAEVIAEAIADYNAQKLYYGIV
ncbi:MAG: hypothetical protein HZB65_00545 [Candidatus Aenigmarchaeota archaeon]|nr:hypothetical protein [Candidatus Aenigmarchaeota archaeon]